MRDDGRFHVMHKSVVDWLRKKEQAKEFFISDEDVYEANAALAKACIASSYASCGLASCSMPQ